MLGLLGSLTPEIIASGIIGFFMMGVVIRNVVVGWRDAQSKIREKERSSGPLSTAFSVGWNADQIERALQTLENIAENLALQVKHTEAISRAQGLMSDQFQQTTQSRLNDILERLDKAETKNPVQRPSRR